MARQYVAHDHSRLVAIAETATASTNLKGFDFACRYVQEEVTISCIRLCHVGGRDVKALALVE